MPLTRLRCLLAGTVLCLVSARAGADMPRGTYEQVDEPPLDAFRIGPGPQHRVIYLNRAGGTFTRGQNDSALNVSSIAKGTVHVSAWSWGDEKWRALALCVKDMYARFDMEITDVNPGESPHIEAVVGGTPGELGLDDRTGGIAPMNLNCSVVERAVTYTFAGVYLGDVQSICETVAQETAHSLGLDHVVLCEDPMTYLSGCGRKTFQATAAPCGEGRARTCLCGGEAQNSVEHLFAVLGPAPLPRDITPPAVDITSPTDGDRLLGGFVVESTVSDDTGVASVEFRMDDLTLETVARPPFHFQTSAELPRGRHAIEVRAVDRAGHSASATLTVEVADCLTDEQCSAGARCVEGDCLASPAPIAPNPGTRGDPPHGIVPGDVIGSCQSTPGRPTSPLLLLILLWTGSAFSTFRHQRPPREPSRRVQADQAHMNCA